MFLHLWERFLWGKYSSAADGYTIQQVLRKGISAFVILKHLVQFLVVLGGDSFPKELLVIFRQGIYPGLQNLAGKLMTGFIDGHIFSVNGNAVFGRGFRFGLHRRGERGSAFLT